MSLVDAFLESLRHDGAKAVFLRPGQMPAWRVAGEVLPRGEPLPEAEEFDEMFLELAKEAGKGERFRTASDLEFTCARDGAYFRIQVYRGQDGRTAVIHPVPEVVASPVELGLSNRLQEAVAATSGLVLLCGPRRSGRTTAVASLLDTVNRVHTRYLVSIERELQFRLVPKRSVLHQVRVGIDVPSFAAGVQGARSAGADLIAVGAVEDEETARQVIYAADNGAGVIAVLNAHGVVAGVQRFLDLLPKADQGLYRSCLAQNLSLAIYQHLIRTRNGFAPVDAYLAGVPDVREILRSGDLDDLGKLLSGPSRRSVKTLDDSIEQLARRGDISREYALRIARDRQRMEQRIAPR